MVLQAHRSFVADALVEFTRAYRSLGEDVESTLRDLYIVENPHPLGMKDRLRDGGTGSEYDAVHALYHAEFDDLQNRMGYYDVFLFDPDGNLVYSVFKENDLQQT